MGSIHRIYNKKTTKKAVNKNGGGICSEPTPNHNH